MELNNIQAENREQEEISIIEIFFHYLRYWKWFLLSIAICMGLACAYIFYTIPQYRVVSKVLISDEKRGQTMEMVSAFNDLGISAHSNLDNEIEILRSRTLMKSVADSLRTGVSYHKKGMLKGKEIYKKTPVFVSVPNPIAFGSFTVDEVSESVLLIHSDKENFSQQVEIGNELNSPWGILSFSLNPFGTESFPVEVSVGPAFLPSVGVDNINKLSTVVELSMITTTPQKGQDVINTLVANYNKNAIEDKNYVANSTIDFINERLLEVGSDLQEAEKQVEHYQISQGITDLHAQGSLLLSSSNEYRKKIMDVDIQLNLLSEIKAFLLNPTKQENAIPSSIGISDPTVNSLISKYNEANLEKQRETKGMLETHTKLIEYNNRMAFLRNEVLTGINLSEAGLLATKKEWQRQENMSAGKARNLTTQERETRDLLRQQSLKETLFKYLMQKREETLLSLAMATPNARVIDPAFYSSRPIKPQKKIILLTALMIGMIIPIAIIYLKDLFDNKIHTKGDVTKIISAPFLGLVPTMKGNMVPFPVLRVQSAMAEQFRSIISNLDFVLGRNEKQKIISVTSITGGDGKSFFSQNLAMTLATNGKKTLLIDLDLRKSVLVKTLDKVARERGTAAFLSDPKIELREIIDTSHSYHKNLDIIPVRVFPPNPAELLSSERLEQFFQSIAKEDYEYVIIDTAPAGLVSDIYNINPYTLATIFLLRSDYTLKKTLPEIQGLYKDKKLNNLCVVLNAVTDENIHRYGHKHSYYTNDEIISN